jgi:hypothetical protein
MFSGSILAGGANDEPITRNRETDSRLVVAIDSGVALDENVGSSISGRANVSALTATSCACTKTASSPTGYLMLRWPAHGSSLTSRTETVR